MMATVNMDSVQFYEPPFINPFFGGKHAASLHIDPKPSAAPRHKKGSQVLEPFGGAALNRWGDFGSQYKSGRDQDVVSEDDLPTLKELLCPTLHKEVSIEELEDPKHALQTANQRSLQRNGSHINTAQLRSVDLGNSQESPVLIDDDESDNTDTETASTDSNAAGADQRVALCPSPTTNSSIGDDLGGADGLEDDYVEERLRSALVNQDSAIPACPRELSLHPPSKSLQELVSQDDASCPISRNAPEEPSYSTIDISDENDKTEKQQQQNQEAQQEEQEEHSHNSSGNGDSDDNHDQDSSDSEGPRPAKRRRLSCFSRDCASKRICKRRLQQPRDSRSAPVQAQLECALSRSQRSSTHSSLSGEESMPNTRAAYQEWPMYGFLKRMTIEDEIRYSMEFSLEQLHELCALACPQHSSQAGSNRDSSTGSASSSRLPTRAKRNRSSPPSQIKGTRFTEEEDAKLINMKEKKGRSWDEIEVGFPGRTRAALQVHYSTKLKNRASLSRKQQRGKRQSRQYGL